MDSAATPRLSLIVPAHNAAGYMRQTLSAIAAALRPGYEFIVVDDASTDETARLAESAGARVVRLEEKTGPSGARNEGARIATGAILAFLDADVEPQPHTLQKLQESLEKYPHISAVFGSYDDAPADRRLVSSFKNLMHHYVHQHGDPAAQTFWTGCGAIRRDVFEQVGPFRKVSIVCVEDIDYGHRLRDAGHQIWLRKDVLCKHLKRWTLGGLVRTDVMQRGIPWTVMMLRRGKADAELNLNWTHRLSALLAAGVAFSLLSCIYVLVVFRMFFWVLPADGPAGFSSMTWVSMIMGMLSSVASGFACIAGMVGLQWGFYQFLSQKRGWWFAVACVPLHLLYYWYSVFSLAAGFVVHMSHSDARSE